MMHVCDDTAYPAAAMPDECTCGDEPMTEWTPTDELNGRRILMPEARSFSDVLEYVAEWDHATMSATDGKVPSTRPEAQYLPAGTDILDRILAIGGFSTSSAEDRNEVGPYCSISTASRRHRGVAVRATDAALAAVAPHLVTSDDRMSWKVIEHADTERALVILEHGQIIGSHWVAYIDASTLPA